MLKVRIIGGGDHIGANSYLLETEGRKILLDCGISQKETDYKSLPRIELIGNKLDAILVSHAHLDHIGALPVLMDRYPEAEVWMSAPTKELVRLVVKDTFKILSYRSCDIGRLPYYDLYKKENFDKKIKDIKTAECKKPFKIKGTNITFHQAGHIIGSVMIQLNFRDSGINVLYTGDFSSKGTVTEEKPVFDAFSGIDLLISECTYGGGTVETRDVPMETFIKKILDKKGRVLIPAFGIGRTQDMLGKLCDMRKKRLLPDDADIFVVGMGVAVNRVYNNHYGNSVSFLNEAKPLKTTEALANKRKYICVATSGMVMPNTPSYILAQDILPDKRSGILFPTSFESEEAIGYKTMSRKNGIRFGKRKIERKCDINKTDFSAHIGKNDLINALTEKLKPRCVLFVHPGDNTAREKLAGAVRRKHPCTVLYPETKAEEFNITKKNGEVKMNSSANLKAAIITVGTSILTNTKSKPPYDDGALIKLLNEEPRKNSAELNTYLGMPKEKRACDRIILLCSKDGGDGEFCGNILRRYFTDRGINAELRKIDGLGKDAETFRKKGLPNFVDELIKTIESYNSDSYIVATGGFKAATAYATIISVIFRRDTYYMHDDFKTVIPLPKLPVYFDAIYRLNPATWRKFRNMMYANTSDEADEIYNSLDPDIQGLFFKEGVKYSYTALGRLTTWAYIHSEKRQGRKLSSIKISKVIRGIMSKSLADKTTVIELDDIEDEKAQTCIRDILKIYEVDSILIEGESLIAPVEKLSERVSPRGSILYYTIKTDRNSGIDVKINVLAGTEKDVENKLRKLNKKPQQ